jgi:branched-chain amino acid transport system substrate-binding protein
LIKGLETMHDFDLGDYFVSYRPESHIGSRFVEIDVLNRDGNVIR